MAITINMQYNFTTRAVFSKEIIEAIREQYEDVANAVEAAISLGRHSSKEVAQMKVGLRRCKEWLAMSDDSLCESLVKEATKNSFKDSLKDFFKDLQVTRVSPVQVTRVEKVSKKVSEASLKAASTCGLHGEEKACTALCKRFTVTQ